jgi:hypothetical protein
MKKTLFIALVAFAFTACQKETETPLAAKQEVVAKRNSKENRGARLDAGTKHNLNSCTNFETIYYDKYFVHNNNWNTSSSGFGWGCIWSAGDTGWWSWGTSSGHTESTGATKSYPSVVRGWHYGRWSNNSGMPKQVSTLGGCTTSWNFSAPTSGRHAASYDIYFSRSTNVGSNKSNMSCNILVNLNNTNYYNWPGWDNGMTTVNLAGHTWKYKVVNDTQNGNTFKWATYIRTSNTNSVSNLNLKALFDHSRGQGNLSNNDHLVSIQAGWEVVDGANGGQFKTNSYSTNIW